jgi:orotidine-5'-phosphate decarboxylase
VDENALGRVIVALDAADEAAARAMLARLPVGVRRVKVGKQLFTAAGPRFIEHLHAQGLEVFLDLKYHDIPNTVAGAVAAAADLGVWMVNVHAGGGPAMLAAAREALEGRQGRPWLIAVTVLTSLDAGELQAVGVDDPPARQVHRLAGLARNADLDGVVTSPREVADLRASFGSDLALVTPGVRPAGANSGDQRRVATPGAAVANGSDFLVVGRPITAAADPAVALDAVVREVANAEPQRGTP